MSNSKNLVSRSSAYHTNWPGAEERQQLAAFYGWPNPSPRDAKAEQTA